MATITITERHHWKKRAESKIHHRIRELRSSSADVIDKAKEEAKATVAAHLDLATEFERHSGLETAIRELSQERDALVHSIAHKIFLEDEPPFNVDMRDIRSEITSLEVAEADKILALLPLGQEIARLEIACEELADRMLLATTVQQVTALLDRVDELVSDKPAEPEQPSLMLNEYSYQS